MEISVFYATVAAVFMGNAITGVFVYFLWAATKAEKAGGSGSDLPWKVLICGAIPPIIAIIGIKWGVHIAP